MYHAASNSRKLSNVSWAVRRIMSVALCYAILADSLAACDVCLQAPRIPFAIDNPAAIEVAMATCEAAEQGWFVLNPVIHGALATDRLVPPNLRDISASQLVKLWMQTQPARRHRGLRITVDVVFVETETICHLDVRQGSVLVDAGQNGPADIRILTTKSGFYRVLMSGLEECESRKLVAIEGDDLRFHEDLTQLFATAPSVAKSPATDEPNSELALLDETSI